MRPHLDRLRALVCCLPCVSAALFCLLSACEGPGPILEPLIYAKRGGMSPQTEFWFFQSSVDGPIRDEIAGKKPHGEPTWQQYWQRRYDLLRVSIIHGDPLGQQYIDYLHNLRHAYNLPLYDNGKPPSKSVYGL